MQHFSPEETRRWDVWQDAYAASSRNGDRLGRIYAATMFSAAAAVLAIALWLR